MSRQVFSRDIRLDAVKAAVTFAAAGSDNPETRAWAVRRWGEDGAPGAVTKAETPAMTISDIDPSNTAGLIDRELFKAVKERALLFRMRGWRRTGFRVRSITVSNSVAAWVEEGKPIPVLQPTIDNVGLEPGKLCALSCWTKESVETSPGIEQLIFDDLTRAYVDALDLAMFDPDNDGSGAAPASLTNGALAIASTGDIGEDLAELFAAFTGNLAGAYFITTPEVAAGLAAEPIGRDVGARGGDLAGVPVLTATAAPGGLLTLIDPTFVLAAHDDDLELSTGREASIEMLDSSLQGSAVADVNGASLVSMWQTNTVAIRAVGRVAWAAARPGAAVSITGLFPSAT